ncbi:MAG: C2 family cysteine protease [Bacillota bacterium]|nr:C2 family cysteine protease [Bacillota bacterium]
MEIYKKKSEYKQRQKLETMVHEDRKTIDVYQNMAQEKLSYQYSMRKSMVRNYRDFMIYRAMKAEEAQEYGKFQQAADYVNRHKNRLGELKMPGMEETAAFSLDQVVLHLCNSTVLQDTVSQEDMRSIVDQLMAGNYIQQGNPNAEDCRQIEREGLRSLQEIYFRQLDGLRRKYDGEKLRKLSPSSFLKQYDILERDFACIEDMETFFGTYAGELENSPEMKKMMELLTYYSVTWKALKRRQNAFENGDLDGRAEAEFREQTKYVYEAAKEKGILEGKKPRVNVNLEEKRKRQREKRSAIIEAQSKHERMLEADEKMSAEMYRIESAYEELSRAWIIYKNDIQDREKEALERKEEKKEEIPENKLTEEERKHREEEQKRIAEREKRIAEYEKRTDVFREDEAEQALKEWVAERKARFDSGIGDVTQENVLTYGQDTIAEIEALENTLKGCSDADFIEQYSQLLLKRERLEAKVNRLRYSDVFSVAREKLKDLGQLPQEEVEKREAEKKRYESIRQMDHRFANIQTEFPLYQKAEKIIKTRAASIEKYGYTVGGSMAELEDMAELLYSYAERKTEQQRGAAASEANGRGETSRLRRALGHSFRGNPFSELKKLDKDQIKTELSDCRFISELRRQQPNFYHLGLTAEEHVKAEKMCALLPLYERAYELTLQYLGETKHGASSFGALEQEWKEAVKRFMAIYRTASHTVNVEKFKVENRYQKQQDRINAFLKDPSLLLEEKEAEVLKISVQGFDFVTEHTEEMKKKDIGYIYDVSNCIHLAEKNEAAVVDDKALDGIAVLSCRFFAEIEQIKGVLKEAEYGDYAFFTNRENLFRCQKQSYYLEKITENKRLMESLRQRCGEREELEYLKLMLEKMPKQMREIRAMAEYAAALEINYAILNGINEMSVYSGNNHTLMSGKHLKTTAQMKRMQSEWIIHQLRAEKGKIDYAEEIRKQQMEARIRHALGQEKLASDAKTFAANLKQVESLESLGGNLIGAPLQLFGWLMHEPRTAEHGMVCYQKCVEKHIEMQRMLGVDAGMMQEASLPKQWQRGSQDYAPTIDLDALFASPMKKRIHGLIKRPELASSMQFTLEDEKDAEFLIAMDAISRYTTVLGIVNTDTTEMEMAFLDTFRKKAQDYLEYHIACEEESVVQRCDILREILQELKGNLDGTMAETMSEEELEKIKEGTVAYVENTIYSQNMEESNIQDIPLFLHEPNINDVKQSAIGDCWLVSAISALVRSSPEFIRSMFHDTGDGDVIVRLYQAERYGERITSNQAMQKDRESIRIFPVYVKLRKHYETGWGNACDCTWVQLLEKAYALTGMNMRNEMRIEGNQMYNVVDELTYGLHDVALLHMTGYFPEEIKNGVKYKPKENDFYDSVFLASMLEGFTPVVVNQAVTELFTEEEKKLQENSIGKLANLIKELGVPEEEVEKQLLQNIENARLGIRGEKFGANLRDIHGTRNNYAQKLGAENKYTDLESERTAVATCAEYFAEGRKDGYTVEEHIFYQRCKKAFAEKSTLSVAIPHCVDLLDAQEKNGKYFILLRDPFNIYNHTYTMEKDSKVKLTQEGLGTVLMGHKQNRELTGNGAEMLFYGFRGTSWVELKDLYRVVYGIYKAPVNLKVNNDWNMGL